MLDIKEPTLLLDKEKCIRNIDRMVNKASRHGVILRPHFKTHAAADIADWFLERGVRSIAVSSVQMADYFHHNNWEDITVAFPVNILEMDRINKIAGKISLNLMVENTETTRFLSSNLLSPTGIFLKIDTGYHRTGIDPDNVRLIDDIIQIIKSSPNMRFRGFLAHAGHTYQAGTKQEILDIHETSLRIMNGLRNTYINDHPDIELSLGDTPSCSVADDFTGLTEIRPGNFVFYDLKQESLGSCSIDDIAVAMACPVVAVHKDRNEVIIYGGGIHFSKDSLISDGGTIYGKLVSHDKHYSWDRPLEGAVLKSLSQEHGILRINQPDLLGSIRPGQILMFLPVHSCLTSNLMRKYITLDGDIILRV